MIDSGLVRRDWLDLLGIKFTATQVSGSVSEPFPLTVSLAKVLDHTYRKDERAVAIRVDLSVFHRQIRRRNLNDLLGK